MGYTVEALSTVSVYPRGALTCHDETELLHASQNVGSNGCHGVFLIILRPLQHGISFVVMGHIVLWTTKVQNHS